LSLVKNFNKDIFESLNLRSQTMDIVATAICPVVCQKSDSLGNIDFQNSQKLDPFKYQLKIKPIYSSISKMFWCKKLTQGALQK
jgi:hypothetical protein